MSEFWYCAEGEETRGPITFDQLLEIISSSPSPRMTLVWRDGFADWKTAENVREVVERLFRPPPLGPRSSVAAPREERLPAVMEGKLTNAAVDKDDLDAVTRHEQQFDKVPKLPSGQSANKGGRLAFWIVFVFVLSTGAYFTNQIFSNSVDGIARISGELFGAWALLTLLAWRVRKGRYAAAVVLAVAASSVALSNLGKLQESIAIREGRAALQGATDPKQIDEALRQHPSNTFLQMMAMANAASTEASAAFEKLSAEIEPVALSKDTNFVTASRSELEALRRDLKKAEAKSTAFMPRYLAILKAERDKAENHALSLHFEKSTVSSFLSGIDRRHATGTAFTSKMMLARTEFYRAYEAYVAVLSEEYGAYSVVNDQFTFPLQRTADRYNVALNAMNEAAKRLSELDAERKQLTQSQQDRWEQFVKSK